MHERESPEVKGLMEGLEDGPNEAQKALVQMCARGRKKASGGVKTSRRVLHSRLQGQFGS